MARIVTTTMLPSRKVSSRRRLAPNRTPPVCFSGRGVPTSVVTGGQALETPAAFDVPS